MRAINLRRPNKGDMFHCDYGSQYTNRRFPKLLD
ncbi:MAG: hypothetical protein ACI8PW_001708, partial [Methylophilaceae bacterium]